MSPTDRVSCSRRSRELGEPLGGTAALASGWICVEHRGPWSPSAPSAAELGETVAAMTSPGVRLQLIRRPVEAHVDDHTAAAGPLTVLLAHGGIAPGDRWARRISVADPAELVALVDPAVTTAATPPSFGEPVTGDVWLVCTHGRRDACCALHGRPVAAALRDAGAEVWETTHTGGHRFAATALLLPDGLSLGRLDAVAPATLLTDVAQGRLDPSLLRGRCALPRPVQAAETLVRIQLGVRGRDDLLPSSWTSSGERTVVVLVGLGSTWQATIERSAADPPRPVSDDADPTTPDTYRLRDLVRA